MEHMKQVQPPEKTSEVKLVITSGDSINYITHVQAPVQVGNFRTIHHFHNFSRFDVPQCNGSEMSKLLEEYKDLFS